MGTDYFAVPAAFVGILYLIVEITAAVRYHSLHPVDLASAPPRRGNTTDRAAELHGGWAGALDPLDAGLRGEILKYGEFAEATYDAFDGRHWSPHCGTCLHGLRRMLPALGLAGHGYVATAFLYATCDVDLPHWLALPLHLHAEAWDRHANWIGFVAVAGAAEARRAGHRDVVVVWRGTMTKKEWRMDLKTSLVPFELDDTGKDGSGAMVAHGFHSIYASANASSKYGSRSAREQVADELARLVRHFRARGEEVRVTATGHSLGGALALLAARDAAAAHPGVAVRAVTFSAPRVGNKAFCDGLAAHGVSVLRVVVRHDVVPTVPTVTGWVLDAPASVLLDKLWALVGRRPPVWLYARVSGVWDGLWALAGRPPSWAYVHAGDELVLDPADSPHVKRSYDPVGFHSLELCLHLVDGLAGVLWRGEARRDVALVNKRSGMLRDEEHVPESWCQPENKGLVRDVEGRWVMPNREPDDLPVPDDRLPLSELD